MFVHLPHSGSLSTFLSDSPPAMLFYWEPNASIAHLPPSTLHPPRPESSRQTHVILSLAFSLTRCLLCLKRGRTHAGPPLLPPETHPEVPQTSVQWDLGNPHTRTCCSQPGSTQLQGAWPQRPHGLRHALTRQRCYLVLGLADPSSKRTICRPRGFLGVLPYIISRNTARNATRGVSTPFQRKHLTTHNSRLTS